jgi:hypothetical protein
MPAKVGTRKARGSSRTKKSGTRKATMTGGGLFSKSTPVDLSHDAGIKLNRLQKNKIIASNSIKTIKGQIAAQIREQGKQATVKTGSTEWKPSFSSRVSAAMPASFIRITNPGLEIRGNAIKAPRYNNNNPKRNAYKAYKAAVNKLKSIKANIESIRAGESNA